MDEILGMEFYQHIYGRVAKGYQTNYSAYQIAALTDSLASRQELLQKLNRYSFFHRYEGEGNQERYCFYRPMLGYLVFGCSRLVKDATGSIGSFAHNFVCEENDFLYSDVSPIALLKSLPFVKSEEEIGSSRSLPLYQPGAVEETQSHPEWRSFALSLIDTYLEESALVIPLVVAGEEETWDLLGELFSLLPRQEAVRLSFSTLFKDAIDYIEEFRLVFVPDQKTVPRDSQIYRVLDPGPERVAPITAPRVAPLTNFWRAAPGAGPVLIRYADLLKFDKAPESAQYLPSLLAPGVSRLFREAVESLNVPHIYSSLVRGADWLVEYGRAGGPLQPDSVIAAVWEDAEAYLPRALDAAQRLQQWFLREALHEHLARRIAGGAPELALVGQLAGAGHLAAFCETVITSGGLADRQREIVAERLRNERYYSGQIHRAIAGKLLRQMAGGERKDAYRTGQWLNDEARLLTDHFVAAAAELWSLSETPIGRRWELRLEKYRLDGVEQYQSLLRVAWMLSLPFIWQKRVLSVYHPDYREAFFAFCARRLKEEDFSEQRDFLRVLAQICKPYGSENAPLIEAIRTEDRSYDLAQYYANLLLRLDKPDVETIRRLQSVRPPPSLWGKLWR